ncbi:PREDICTED: titin-like isoform X12 [Branchiostoma belcheri]|uniref:Titin-like isoform X12 n=1 Tax=Branchiostoma belcheri TaxID=7741 RepID=A0A6P4Z337_BRABE|nr:PREDICTED: titin-like isoform X12 [Branchiostoma belcheri]
MAEGGDAATVAHEAGNAVQETPKAEPEKAAAAAEPAAPAEPPEPTVRTIVLTGHGGYDKLSVQQKPQPKAGKGEVLVRVKAAGLNFSELMVRQGLHDRMTKPPVVLGMEAAGVIEELGEDVSDFEVGQNVICLAQTGMWREIVAVPATNVFVMPEEMSYEEGAAIPLSYLTAYFMLFDFGNLRPGKSLLVHIAAGGVGWAATQLAKTVENVTVFGTASATKHDAIKENGVDHPIDYRTRDYSEEIKNISPKGVDIVLDPLGGADTSKGLQLLRPMGKIVTYGSANMVKGENRNLMKMAKTLWQSTSVSPVSLVKTNKAIAGFQLAHLTGEIELVRSAFQDILNMYKDGKIKPRIDSVWAFEQVAEAMQQMNERRNIGKVILSPEKEPTKPAEGDAAPTSPLKKKKPSLFRRLSKRASRSKDEGEKKDEVKNAKKESPIKKLRARLSGGDSNIEDTDKVVNDKIDAAEDKIGGISKTVDGKVGDAEKAAEETAKKVEEKADEAKDKAEDAKKAVEAQVEQTAAKLPDTGTSAKIAVDDIFKEAEAKVDGNIQQCVDGTVEEGGVAAKVAMFEQIDTDLPEDVSISEKSTTRKTASTTAQNTKHKPTTKEAKQSSFPNSVPKVKIQKKAGQKELHKREMDRLFKQKKNSHVKNLKLVIGEVHREDILEEPIIKEAVVKDLSPKEGQKKARSKIVKDEISKKVVPENIEKETSKAVDKTISDVWLRMASDEVPKKVVKEVVLKKVVKENIPRTDVKEVVKEAPKEVVREGVKKDVKKNVVPKKVQEEVVYKEILKEEVVKKVVKNCAKEVVKEEVVEKVVKRVPKEVVKEDIVVKVVKEVPKEVRKEEVVEKVVKEVPKEVVKEEVVKKVVKEAPKEVVKEEVVKKVVKEVPKEVMKEEVVKKVVKEAPKEVVKEEVVEKVVKEVPKEVMKEEVVKKVVKEAPKEVVKEEVVEKVVKEVPREGVKEDVVEKVVKEVPKEVVKEEVVEKVPKEVPKEVVKEEVVKKVPKEVSKEVVKEEVVEKVPKEVPKEVVKEEVVEKVVKEVPKEVVKEEVVEKVPKEVSKEVVKEEIVEKVVKEVPKEVVRETVFKKVVKDVPKEVVKEAPKDIVKEVVPKEVVSKKIVKDEVEKIVNKALTKLVEESIFREDKIGKKDESGKKEVSSEQVSQSMVIKDSKFATKKRFQTETVVVNGTDRTMSSNSALHVIYKDEEKAGETKRLVKKQESNIKYDGSSSHNLPFLTQNQRNKNYSKQTNGPCIIKINCEDSEVESDHDSVENFIEVKSKLSEHFGGAGQEGGTSTAETVEAQGGELEPVVVRVGMASPNSLAQLGKNAEEAVNGVAEAAVVAENVEEKLEEGKEKAEDVIKQTEEKVDEAAKQEEAPTEPAAQEEKKDEAPADEPEKIEVAVENPAETDDAKAAAADIVADEKPAENEEKGDASQETD